MKERESINNNRAKEFINSVLDDFYTQAVSDFLIGYQFRKIKELPESSVEDVLFPALAAFSTHLARIRLFWHIQLLGAKRPADIAPFDLIVAHRDLRINQGELDRWVLLFKATLARHQQGEQDAALDELAHEWLKKVDIFKGKLQQLI